MPKIFLSSTIYDLADLRSAIKYWLEEYGFEVLGSEWPDFPHPLDRELIEAALAPIEDCDYYLLLIGRRRGTVRPELGVSVTRAEFRRAREVRRRTGKAKPLHLVRRDVAEGRGEQKPKLVEETDWPDVESFVNEVRSQGEKGDPTWLNTFDTFKDVVDVFRATLRISGPLVKRALEANLIWEITENTRELLERGTKEIAPHALWFPSDITNNMPLSKIEESVPVDFKIAYQMIRFRIGLPRAQLQTTSALELAIDGGLFLEYDPEKDAYVIGPFQKMLLELRQQFRSLGNIIKTINSDETITQDMGGLAEAVRLRNDGELRVYTGRFLHGAWAATMNVLRLNRAIYRVLVGADPTVQAPELEVLFAKDEDEKMKAEIVTDADAKTWLRQPPQSWHLPLRED